MESMYYGSMKQNGKGLNDFIYHIQQPKGEVPTCHVYNKDASVFNPVWERYSPNPAPSGLSVWQLVSEKLSDSGVEEEYRKLTDNYRDLIFTGILMHYVPNPYNNRLIDPIILFKAHDKSQDTALPSFVISVLDFTPGEPKYTPMASYEPLSPILVPETLKTLDYYQGVIVTVAKKRDASLKYHGEQL